MTEIMPGTTTGTMINSSAGPGWHRRLGLGLALLLGLAAGCAKRPVLAPASAAPTAASAHTEIVELEKTIAENKPLLRGGNERAAAPAAADSAATPLATSGAPSSRCDGVCRAAQEICTASRRICQISLDVADTAVAASCQRSERTCTEAGALCAQCR